MVKKRIITLHLTTTEYSFLSLTAIAGESSPLLLSRLGISSSYGAKLITSLKKEGYIRTHYRNKLRGYRLTAKGKRLLLSENRERFSFYLTGNSETNRPRSELPRRRRLQQASLIYTMLLRCGIPFFRDQKPDLFGNPAPARSSPLPVFYHSRELKELGGEAVKINSSRFMGILLTEGCIYILYHTGDAPMKWEYRTELKLKALLRYHTSQGILCGEYLAAGYSYDTPVKALFIGNEMETCLKLLNSDGGFHKTYFHLDASFDYFHFIPDSAEGRSLLWLLCFPEIKTELDSILLSDLDPPDLMMGFFHEGTTEGKPVLLAYDLDMLQLSRFHTALSLRGLSGRLICFDFQKEMLARYFGKTVSFTTIDLQKFERRFLCPSP